MERLPRDWDCFWDLQPIAMHFEHHLSICGFEFPQEFGQNH